MEIIIGGQRYYNNKICQQPIEFNVNKECGFNVIFNINWDHKCLM